MVKSHHNVGGLPEDLQFELVEPLKQLFKDEVRACGIEPYSPGGMVYRQPFPGPGLGVRCLGAITRTGWKRYGKRMRFCGKSSNARDWIRRYGSILRSYRTLSLWV